MTHSLNVLGGGTIPIFGRDREPLDRFFARQAQFPFGALQTLNSMAQCRRPLEDGEFQAFPMGAVLNFQTPTPEGVGDVDDDLVRFEGLENIPISPHFERYGSEFGVI